MKNASLLKKITELGYPLLETEAIVHANETLVEVSKSRVPRILEGFPLMLANCLERDLFDYEVVLTHLKSSVDKKNFNYLVIMSLALYEYLELKLTSAEMLFNTDYFDERLFDRFLNGFKNKIDLIENGIKLSSVRVVNTFKNYFRDVKINLRDYTEMRDKFDLEYALSQVFSRKQKELFKKKLRGERLTKTEREYFSRIVKKKVLALANSDLHRLALRLIKE